MILRTVRKLGRLSANTSGQIRASAAVEARWYIPPAAAHDRKGAADEDAQAWTEWPRGLRDRPRLHGHVGLLRPRRRGRGARHDYPRARSRLQLSGHLGHV